MQYPKNPAGAHAQSKDSVSFSPKTTGGAPPVYRPVPSVQPLSGGMSSTSVHRAGTAPSVYRVQQSRQTLQPKWAVLPNSAFKAGDPPPVYRPQGDLSNQAPGRGAPPVYNPYQLPRMVQPKIGRPPGSQLQPGVLKPASLPHRAGSLDFQSNQAQRMISQSPNSAAPTPNRERVLQPHQHFTSGLPQFAQSRTAESPAPRRPAGIPGLRFPGVPHRIIQLMPSADQLYSYCDALEGKEKSKGAGKLLQVQAMAVGSAVVISANKGDLYSFVSKGESLKKTTVGDEEFVIKAASTAAAAADKIGSGGIIVLAPDNSLHSEQHLLLALAYYMGKGINPGNVTIAGRAEPCKACRKVLAAFKTAYDLKHGMLTYRNTGQGQDRGGGTLDLRDHFHGLSDGDFKTFVDGYSAILYPKKTSEKIDNKSSESSSTESGSTGSSSTENISSGSSVSLIKSSIRKSSKPKSRYKSVTDKNPIVKVPKQNTSKGSSWRGYVYAGGTLVLGLTIWGLSKMIQTKQPDGRPGWPPPYRP